MVELIVSEKPSAAKKIAEALADGKPKKIKSKKSSYYELMHGKNKIIVTSAVGHLYGLVEKEKKGWTYPVFEIKWQANNITSKNLDYVKDYIDTIIFLSKKVNDITIACDYDVEGEVIGLNVVRFACGRKDANRMKFSTLTKGDLVEAYEKKNKHLDWGQANAGETRHMLDWFYGINLSRALTASVKAAGSFKVMSAGRVQGPALKLLVDREREIRKFKPELFWEIEFHGEFKKNLIEGAHTKGKIFDKKEVIKIMSKVKGKKEAIVTEVKRTQRKQTPPFPFDLTSLQSESYAQFKLTPKATLAVAQSLYLAGVTSYPRTSSQKLDPKLGFNKILKKLSKQPHYTKLCDELLSWKELKPNNGKKTDPAHPAIYPTGLTPKTLKPHEKKVYDLIVKRFMATFAAPALRETMEIFLDVNKEPFVAKGTRTLEENWHIFYKPYVKLEELTLPEMQENDVVKVKKIEKIAKETQPPKRFNQSSIIKELEARNLGTKATRADILDRLFQRGYVEGVQIHVTKLGEETIVILEKYAPTIVDEKLTAEFELEMEKIREGKNKQSTVLEKAKKFLTKLLVDFKKKEKQIGKEIITSVRATQDEQNFIGECMVCKKGKLMIRFGKFGKFIACDSYPACKTTFKIPSGIVKRVDKQCEHDNYPLVQVIQKTKRPRIYCLKPDCKTKVSAAEAKEVKKIEKRKIKRNCPKCGKELVVRKSFYGEFLACPGFPKCRYTESYDDKTGHFKKPLTKEEREAEKKKKAGKKEK
jgi:DNA topoisomerase I